MTTNIEFKVKLTKSEILQRLFQAGQITFEELITLTIDEPKVVYIQPYTPPPNTWEFPFTITCDTDTTKLPDGRASLTINSAASNLQNINGISTKQDI